MRSIIFLPALVLHAGIAFAEDATQKIRADAMLAHATSLYRDCQAVPRNTATIDVGRLQASWGASYESVKKYLHKDNGQAVKNALSLKPLIPNSEFSTHGTVKDILDLLDQSTILVRDNPEPAYAFVKSILKIVVTSGFIRHICDYLLPEDVFIELARQAETAAQDRRPEDRQKKETAARIKSTEVLAKFFVQSIRYSGLKIFVLGHESSHLLLDRFSSGGKHCLVTTIETETRGDILGWAAVEDIPTSDKIGEILRDQLDGFSSQTMEDMGKLAVRAGFEDVLTIIENEKNWQPDSDCAYSAAQRRFQLRSALELRAKKK